MYNTLISSLLGIAAFFAFSQATASPWWGSLLVAFVVSSGSFVLIARIIMKKVEAIMTGAMKDLQTQRVSSREKQIQLVDRAVKELQPAMKYAKWQVYVGGQVNSTIGMLHYIKRDFVTALPYLEKGFVRNWVTMGMLGSYYFKKGKKDKMCEAFDKAVMGSPKEAMIWVLYAYCLVSSGERSKAVEILEKGLKKNSGNEDIKQKLALVRNEQDMKMADYGEMWYQFHLESPAALQKQQQMTSMTGGMKRKVVRR